MDEPSAREEDQGAAERAERMKRDAERMEERSGELADETERLKRDWESKQREDVVPGAQTEESLAPEVPEDQTDEARGSGRGGEPSPGQNS